MLEKNIRVVSGFVPVITVGVVVIVEVVPEVINPVRKICDITNRQRHLELSDFITK